MALPSKKIKKIKLPGDVSGDKTYEIVPEMLGKNGYSAELPTLTKNVTIATTDDLDSVESCSFESLSTLSDLGGIFAQLGDEQTFSLLFKTPRVVASKTSLLEIRGKQLTQTEYNAFAAASKIELSASFLSGIEGGSDTYSGKILLFKKEILDDEETVSFYAFKGLNVASLLVEIPEEESNSYYIFCAHVSEDLNLLSFTYTNAEEIVDTSIIANLETDLRALVPSRKFSVVKAWKKDLTEAQAMQVLDYNASTNEGNPQYIKLSMPSSLVFYYVHTDCSLIGASPVFISEKYFAQLGNNNGQYSLYVCDISATTYAEANHVHSVTASGSIDLGSNTTGTGGVPYVEVASFVDGVLNLTTKYFHPSFTGTAVDSGTEK